MLIRRAIPMLAVMALSLGAYATIQAQKANTDDFKRLKELAKREAQRAKMGKEGEEKQDPTKQRDQPEAPTLKVYEWGVATMNWDGSSEAPADVPAFYYDNTEVPVEAAPVPTAESPNESPKPNEKPGRITIRKPVVYFECDQDVTFDLDVHFTSGKLTWMYPKPNRMTDASTVQWDNIKMYDDRQPRDKFAPPDLHDVPAESWAN